MANNEAAAAAPAPKRQLRGVNADVLLGGVVALLKGTLSEVPLPGNPASVAAHDRPFDALFGSPQLFAPELVERAVQKALKEPALKGLLDRAKAKAKPAKVKGEEGFTGPVRSAYQAFATLCMHYNPCNMRDAGLFWREMPADLKERVTTRMGQLKDEVAARLARGEQFTLSSALSELEAREQLAPLPWGALLELREGGAGLQGFKVGALHLPANQAADDEDEDDSSSDDSSGSDDSTSSGDSASSLSTSESEEDAPLMPQPAVPAPAPAVAKPAAPAKPTPAKPAAPAAPFKPVVGAAGEKRKAPPSAATAALAAAAAAALPEVKKQKKSKEGKDKAAQPGPSPLVQGEKKHKKEKKETKDKHRPEDSP